MAKTTGARANVWKGGLLITALIMIIAVGAMAVVRIPGDSKKDVTEKEENEGKKHKRKSIRLGPGESIRIE